MNWTSLALVALTLTTIASVGGIVYLLESEHATVAIGGDVVSSGGPPLRVDFLSSSGQNYSAYAQRAKYSLDLPRNDVYRVTVVEQAFPMNHYCNAGTILVTNEDRTLNIVC